MKRFFNVLQGVGLITVLFGVATIESPSIVPYVCLVAGSAVFAIGYKGEKNYVAY